MSGGTAICSRQNRKAIYNRLRLANIRQALVIAYFVVHAEPHRAGGGVLPRFSETSYSRAQVLHIVSVGTPPHIGVFSADVDAMPQVWNSQARDRELLRWRVKEIHSPLWSLGTRGGTSRSCSLTTVRNRGFEWVHIDNCIHMVRLQMSVHTRVQGQWGISVEPVLPGDFHDPEVHRKARKQHVCSIHSHLSMKL